MTFRRLCAALIAVAMSLAPFGMPAMAETAVTPASHHGELAGQAGHCDQQPEPDHLGQSADQGCCVAMCIAVVTPPAVAAPPAYHAGRERPRSDLDRRDVLAEIATPPPRIA